MEGWRRPSEVDGSLVVCSANLFLPRTGFSARSLRRLTSEDPLYVDELSGVYVDGSGEAKATCIVSADWAARRAWIKLVYAHPECVAQLGDWLSKTMLALKAKGIVEVRACDRAGYHFRAGLERSQTHERRILFAHGFRPTRSVADIEVDLNVFREFRPKRFVREGYVFGPPTHREKLLGFVEHVFGEGWRREAEASLDNGGVVQAEKEGEIVGFACYSGFEETWFGPIGVLEQHRGRGVGSELLFAALTRMRERGLGRITIPWTEHLTFYGQTDAVVGVRNLEIMRVTLS